MTVHLFLDPIDDERPGTGMCLSLDAMIMSVGKQSGRPRTADEGTTLCLGTGPRDGLAREKTTEPSEHSRLQPEVPTAVAVGLQEAASMACGVCP